MTIFEKYYEKPFMYKQFANEVILAYYCGKNYFLENMRRSIKAYEAIQRVHHTWARKILIVHALHGL